LLDSPAAVNRRLFKAVLPLLLSGFDWGNSRLLMMFGWFWQLLLRLSVPTQKKKKDQRLHTRLSNTGLERRILIAERHELPLFCYIVV
jgi:hypothetical protein